MKLLNLLGLTLITLSLNANVFDTVSQWYNENKDAVQGWVNDYRNMANPATPSNQPTERVYPKPGVTERGTLKPAVMPYDEVKPAVEPYDSSVIHGGNK